jgi:hypothetical protein
MALPKQPHPIYTTTIPSNDRVISFRPFTVKEEKTLLLAQEADETSLILNSLTEVLRDCIKDDIDVKTLTLFDLEFLMTQIRAKSVGEEVNLALPCKTDSNHRKTPVRIILTDIKVKKFDDHKLDFKLNGGLGIKFKYPTIGSLVTTEQMDGIDYLASCIDYVYDEEQIFPSSEQSHQELKEVITDLTVHQLENIQEQFVEKTPVFEHSFEYTCLECGTKHEKVIKGLSNFFV